MCQQRMGHQLPTHITDASQSLNQYPVRDLVHGQSPQESVIAVINPANIIAIEFAIEHDRTVVKAVAKVVVAVVEIVVIATPVEIVIDQIAIHIVNDRIVTIGHGLEHVVAYHDIVIEIEIENGIEIVLVIVMMALAGINENW